MKRVFLWTVFVAGLALMVLPGIAVAQDLVLPQSNLWFDIKTFTQGKKVRIYATVENPGTVDLKGIIRFFDGEHGPQLKGDQPISAVRGKEDTVFIDIIFAVVGDHEIVAKVIPFDDDGDNPANNTARRTITVLPDFDRDGTPDSVDPDDDNDGTPDGEDAFPMNAKEAKDSDGDGIGNNADTDDDNDGTPDGEDAFPLDAGETKDSDGDGVGDRKDDFPHDAAESRDLDRDGTGDNSDKDADGDGIEKTQDVNDTNLGPKIDIQGLSLYIKPNQEILLDLSGTKDADGSIQDITVTVHQKTSDLLASSAIQLPVFENRTAQYTFPSRGTYVVEVTATDDKGEGRTKSYEVKVGSPLVLMSILFVSLLILILAIFGVFTYAHRARKSFQKRASKSFKKTYKKIRRIL